ncbi:hypothetical protein JYU20_00905 [Bacteroidales bacterium AH-315-I05]|nr:hypothetical protein [Bacteroidales bacterium AH-315-I05]
MKNSFEQRKLKKKNWLPFTYGTVFTILFLAIYFLAWYWPNADFYDYVMGNETGKRFPSSDLLWKTLHFNWTKFLWVEELWIHITAFVFALPVCFVFMRKQKNSLTPLFVFSLIWLIVELHKIPMTYLPKRYILSLIFVMGILISLGLCLLIKSKGKLKYGIIGVALLIGLYNTKVNAKAFLRKSYDLKAINDYLANCEFDERLVIGTWSSSCSWNSNVRTIPVFYEYLNDIEPIKTFKPRLVVTETGNTDLFTTQNINLEELSDSSRSFNVWKYELIFWWMNQEKMN